MTRSKFSTKALLLAGGIGLSAVVFAGLPAAAQVYTCPDGTVSSTVYGCDYNAYGYGYGYPYYYDYPYYGGYGWHGFGHGMGDHGMGRGIGVAHFGGGGFAHGMGGGFHGGGGGHR